MVPSRFSTDGFQIFYVEIFKFTFLCISLYGDSEHFLFTVSPLKWVDGVHGTFNPKYWDSWNLLKQANGATGERKGSLSP